MPQTINDKIELFRKEIIEKASAERDMIMMEAEDVKREELDRAQNRQLEELYQKVQKEKEEIDRQTAQIVAAKRRGLKHELYACREELVGKLMEKVRGRLADFAATKDYQHFLEEKVKQMAQQTPPDENAVLELRSCDMKYGEALSRLYGGCQVRQNDREIKLGGVRIVNSGRNFAVDETLDTALAQQREWFYDHSQFYFD